MVDQMVLSVAKKVVPTADRKVAQRVSEKAYYWAGQMAARKV